MIDYVEHIMAKNDKPTTSLPTITEAVRQAIDDSGLTRYRIAQDTGIDESTLAKFCHGERGLSNENLDRLGVYLGLRVEMDRAARERY